MRWNIARGRQSLALGLALAMASLTLVACGSSDVKSAEKLVTYEGPYAIRGDDAAIYWAQNQGFYKKQGISVSLREGKSSGQTFADVARGDVIVGQVGLQGYLQGLAHDSNVVAVATIYGDTNYGFWIADDTGLNNIPELAGKTILTTTQIAGFGRAVLDAIGLKSATLSNVPAASYIAAFGDKKYGAVFTSKNQIAITKVRSAKFAALRNVGFNFPDYVLITTRDELANNRQAVRAFVEATLEGFQQAQKNKAAAINTLVSKFPQLDPGVATQQLDLAGEILCSPSQKGKPYGFNVESDFERLNKALETAGQPAAPDTLNLVDNSLFDGSNPVHVATC